MEEGGEDEQEDAEDMAKGEVENVDGSGSENLAGLASAEADDDLQEEGLRVDEHEDREAPSGGDGGDGQATD